MGSRVTKYEWATVIGISVVVALFLYHLLNLGVNI